MEENKTYSTAEMWLMAKENGKGYIAGDKTYNRKDGFKYLGHSMGPNDFNICGNFSVFDIFMGINNWVEDPNVMSKLQAEKNLALLL